MKCLYKGFYLASMTRRGEDGRFEAKVAIVAMAGDRTRSQRFLDLEAFSAEADADARAIHAGREWVDKQTQAAARDFRPTNFSDFV